MTLPSYARITEGEAHQLGSGGKLTQGWADSELRDGKLTGIMGIGVRDRGNAAPGFLHRHPGNWTPHAPFWHEPRFSANHQMTRLRRVLTAEAENVVSVGASIASEFGSNACSY